MTKWILGYFNLFFLALADSNTTPASKALPPLTSKSCDVASHEACGDPCSDNGGLQLLNISILPPAQTSLSAPQAPQAPTISSQTGIAMPTGYGNDPRAAWMDDGHLWSGLTWQLLLPSMLMGQGGFRGYMPPMLGSLAGGMGFGASHQLQNNYLPLFWLPLLNQPQSYGEPTGQVWMKLDNPLGAFWAADLQESVFDDVTIYHPKAVIEGSLRLIEIVSRNNHCQPEVKWLAGLYPSHQVALNTWHVLLPVPLSASLGEKWLKVHCIDANQWHSIALSFIKGRFEESIISQLQVDNKFAKLPPAEVVQEQAQIQEVFAKSEEKRLWQQQFLRPTTGAMTSPFGKKRLFNRQIKNRHQGIDFSGEVGTPLYAANDGIVRLAADNFFYVGNAVFIDHGEGLYTLYFHMNSLKVHTADKVLRGQEIGTLGSTGRVTGPHLHFAVRYLGYYVDPDDLLKYDPKQTIQGHALPTEILTVGDEDE